MRAATGPSFAAGHAPAPHGPPPLPSRESDLARPPELARRLSHARPRSLRPPPCGRSYHNRLARAASPAHALARFVLLLPLPVIVRGPGFSLVGWTSQVIVAPSQWTAHPALAPALALALFLAPAPAPAPVLADASGLQLGGPLPFPMTFARLSIHTRTADSCSSDVVRIHTTKNPGSGNSGTSLGLGEVHPSKRLRLGRCPRSS